MNPLPEGLIVTGVIYHGVGELMILPLTYSTADGNRRRPPPSQGGGLVGGWVLVDHGDGSSTGGVGYPTSHIGALKRLSFL